MNAGVILGAAAILCSACIAQAASQPPPGPPAPAASQPPQGPPAPAPEMGQLKDLVAKVSCTGMWHASNFGPEHPVKATFRGQSELGGFLIVARYDERRTKQNPGAGHAFITFAYDADAKQFVSLEYDSFGGHATLTSPGWDGDALTFTGTYMIAGQKLNYRDIYTRKTGGLDHRGEIQGPDGQWTPLDEEQCPP